ncbi:YutD family protein [Paenibacillus soyae]|uniref:YutD family protein n=1 Tax=Paenibacillus soyae TaxID=2969249 RepID=A0A9X2MKH9_9BACL|nr:YutD family protein [Paenibacillus soyae]MCR2802331.1 YutD family protein [Paenibacillus soyae]
MALIHIGGKSYELIHENRNGWNPEAFRNRYSEVLERYDYIIGDWGYNQLRLKGFFRDNHQKATKDSVYSAASDYINEYCNFGCAYFILEKKSGGRAEMNEDDLDLDAEYGDDAVRLEGYDLRAAVESAAVASAAETASASEAPKAAPKEHRPLQNRYRQHQRSDNRGRSGGRNENQAQAGQSSGQGQQQNAGSEQAQGQGQGQGGRRREHHFKNKHRGGGDQKGKKPMKPSSNESAGSSDPNRPHSNNKDAGRS